MPTWEVSGESWARHAHDGARVEGARVELAAGRDEGAVEAVLRGCAPWDRLVPSLEVEPWPAGAQVRVRVRARRGEATTPWAPLGVYGDGPELPRSEVGPDPARIEVDVDTVKLPASAAPADGLEVRLELVRGTDGRSPRVRRVALTTWLGKSRAEAPPSEAARPGERRPAWGRTIELPERSQRVEAPGIASRICSPTSLGMVLARWGHDLPTAEVARRVYDHGAKIYGNWSFNVAAAAALGLEATVVRWERLADLEAEVEAGRPVVISHRYAAGAITGAAIDATDGHLIVVCGFTAVGDVVVHDPAADPRSPGAGGVRRVYRREQLAATWLRSGGIAYRVRAPG